MSNVHLRQLKSPTPAEIDKIAEVLTEAFRPDPMFKASIGGNEELRYPLHRAIVAAVGIAGELYVVGYGKQDILGVAGWFGPGRLLFDSPDQREAGFNEIMTTKFPPELSKWWDDFLRKFDTHTTEVFGEVTKLAAWYLMPIGVLPEYQGKGLGTRLIKEIQSKAIPHGEALCLETNSEKNVEIYKSWGFLVKGRTESYESPQGDFTVWAMIQDPKVLA